MSFADLEAALEPIDFTFVDLLGNETTRRVMAFRGTGLPEEITRRDGRWLLSEDRTRYVEQQPGSTDADA